MTTKAAKAAAAAAAAGDVKKPDELTPENTVDGDDGQNTAAGSGDAGVDLTGSETNGATGLTGAEVARKAVVFLGPYHRYSRGDTACFDAEYAEKLVERHIAVWPKDAKKALSPRQGADDHDTDIG
ncbi:MULTISPECIES: hypothetical protein [Citrobacter]|uniref:Gp7 n=1 Tax=Citrobacter arsenatis TaxID=2546350 RepID=A0A4V1AA35_9ENTR|nr:MULTISPECIES: hypothetical protein [Citrobacter]EKV4660686.1 hypothetical protein [Citrobacter freundii]EKV4665742.1 hypothetical protein [Citrobacter freundii]EKW2235499.1 hypothetical protein [Citrobacter freundii]MDH0321973.1 hypothetical protein [Citrobacter freundii]MDM2789436.1 hypothetical protein [Citrobacter sp. Cpo113]